MSSRNQFFFEIAYQDILIETLLYLIIFGLKMTKKPYQNTRHINNQTMIVLLTITYYTLLQLSKHCINSVVCSLLQPLCCSSRKEGINCECALLRGQNMVR